VAQLSTLGIIITITMKTHHLAKVIQSILMAATLVCMSGCLTANTIEAAKAQSYKNNKGETVVTEPGAPGYYALLPLSVVGDIVTSPIQLPVLLFIYLSGYRG